jgi:hypothetical protein
MKTLADLIDAAERLERLAADARAHCVGASLRLEELRRFGDADHSPVLVQLVQLQAQLRTMEGRR